MIGGIFYFNYPGASGLTSGAVFGRLAGRTAASFARGRIATQPVAESGVRKLA
jgi:tricarballylate dehydrogenase